MNRASYRIVLCLSLGASLFVQTAFSQGPLTPPGPPGPTMKTLQQVEPRTAITNLPIAINAPGSFYLTGNLTGAVQNSGILITTSDVSIDLNGFMLQGVPGSDHGIVVSGIQSNIIIRYGSVASWGSAGIAASLADNSKCENVLVRGNGQDGIYMGYNCLVLNCRAIKNNIGIRLDRSGSVVSCAAQENSSSGIIVNLGCSVIDSQAFQNGGDGINVGTDSVVKNSTGVQNTLDGIIGGIGCAINDCTANDNGGDGIVADTGSTINGCSAKDNGGYGIEVDNGCTVTRSTASGNSFDGIRASRGCTISESTAVQNTTNGIYAADSTTIRACTVRSNEFFGIHVLSDCYVLQNTSGNNGRNAIGVEAGIYASLNGNRIDGNHVTDNNPIGIHVDGSNNLIVRNSASGNTVEYQIAFSPVLPFILNHYGPIYSSPAFSFTNDNPWANFDF